MLSRLFFDSKLASRSARQLFYTCRIALISLGPYQKAINIEAARRTCSLSIGQLDREGDWRSLYGAILSIKTDAPVLTRGKLDAGMILRCIVAKRLSQVFLACKNSLKLKAYGF
jgi:hypothetical protein